jgi:aspartate racemase
MKNNKTIAILGGMGPQASSRLLEVIIRMSSEDFNAKNDDDFPEIILNSIPIADFISNKDNAKPALCKLKKRIKLLEKFKPSCFSIACNTAHILLDKLQKATNISFISIIEEVSREVVKSKIKKVGLLGTPVTIKSKLYQKSLTRKNIKIITLSKNGQIATECIIRNVLAGNSFDKDKKKLLRFSEILKNKGAQGIIFGCTELPLIFPKSTKFTTFDSIEILAKALLAKVFNNTSASR